MFGQGFRRDEGKPLATEGEHIVFLGIPHIESKQGYTWLEFPITYQDGGELEPSSFALFDVPPNATEKEQSEFNRRATKIFDCFDLKNTFDPKEFPLWKGKVGKVEIAKDKKGFLRVSKFIKSKAVEERQAAQSQATLPQNDTPFKR